MKPYRIKFKFVSPPSGGDPQPLKSLDLSGTYFVDGEPDEGGVNIMVSDAGMVPGLQEPRLFVAVGVQRAVTEMMGDYRYRGNGNTIEGVCEKIEPRDAC